MCGELGTAIVLLLSGADMNAAGESDETPLHLASDKGHTLFVATLVCLGADVNARTKKGKTPLDYASRGTLIETMLFVFGSHRTERGW